MRKSKEKQGNLTL